MLNFNLELNLQLVAYWFYICDTDDHDDRQDTTDSCMSSLRRIKFAKNVELYDKKKNK